MLASGWPDLPGIPIEDGAVTSVYLASAPDAAGVSGVYFEDGAAVTPLEAALDVAAQERCGPRSQALVGSARRVAAGYKPCGTVPGTTARRRPRAEDTMSRTPPVTIYSLTTCGWSRKAKEHFKQRGIKAFVIEYDTAGPDLQRKIDAEMRKEKADGFPFVRIGGRVVKGYDPATYDRLLRGA